MTRQSREFGLTRSELVVLVGVIVVITLLAWPAWKSGLAKRDLTRTMNNGRELYLAALRMATDGATKSDASLAWPGDYPVISLAEYCGKLVEKDYLKPADLQRLLSAPGAVCTVTTTGSPPATKVMGSSALKIYKARTTNPSTTIFAASSNYIYATPLKRDAKPFGEAGFIVIHKSGDAGLFGKQQATPAGFENSVAKFQSPIGVGILPGAADGVVRPGDGGTVLAGP